MDCGSDEGIAAVAMAFAMFGAKAASAQSTPAMKDALVLEVVDGHHGAFQKMIDLEMFSLAGPYSRLVLG